LVKLIPPNVLYFNCYLGLVLMLVTRLCSSVNETAQAVIAHTKVHRHGEQSTRVEVILILIAFLSSP
jgi:hypothetical protein